MKVSLQIIWPCMYWKPYKGLNGAWRRHAKNDYYLPNDPRQKGPRYIKPIHRKLPKMENSTKLWLLEAFAHLRDSWPNDSTTEKNVLETHKLALVTPYAFYHSLMKPKIAEKCRLEANAHAEGTQKKEKVFVPPRAVIHPPTWFCFSVTTRNRHCKIW